MKQLTGLLLVVLLSSCALTYPTGGIGPGWVVSVKEPLQVGDHAGGQKVGKTTAHNFIGIVFGDYSISTAVSNAKITEVHTVDKEVRNFFGIYGSITTIVTGE